MQQPSPDPSDYSFWGDDPPAGVVQPLVAAVIVGAYLAVSFAADELVRARRRRQLRSWPWQ